MYDGPALRKGSSAPIAKRVDDNGQQMAWCATMSTRILDRSDVEVDPG